MIKESLNTYVYIQTLSLMYKMRLIRIKS